MLNRIFKIKLKEYTVAYVKFDHIQLSKPHIFIIFKVLKNAAEPL